MAISTLGALAARRLVWILGGAALISQVQAQVPTNIYSYSRTSSFTYYGVSGGAKAGLLQSETIEPGNAQSCVVTTYGYDAYGDKTSAAVANCSGATGRAPFTGRTSSSTFAAVLSQPVTVGTGTANVSIPAGLFADSITNALGHTEYRTYDPRFGALLSLIGPNGATLATNWKVDDFGRITQEKRADGTSTVSAYCTLSSSGLDTSANSSTANGDPLSCPSPSGEAPADAVAFVHTEPWGSTNQKVGPFMRVYKDRLGRDLRSVTESFDGSAQAAGKAGALVFTDAVYNTLGVKVIQTQAYFASTSSSTTTGASDVGVSLTVVDALGRPTYVYVTDPNGLGGNQGFGSYGGSRRVAKTAFTYSGLSATVTNDKGQARTEDKNALGELVRVTDASNATLIHQRDAFGNLVQTKDALGNITTITYDIRGRKTKLQDPDTGTWNYDYDALGQLVWQQSPNQLAQGAQTTMAYDVGGRLTSRGEPEFISTWTYDKNADGSSCMNANANQGKGKLCQSGTSNGVSRQYVYDNLGRPSSSRTTVSSGPSFASSVSYNAEGRIVSQTYPTGVQVGYSYTARGFLEKLVLNTNATVAPLPNASGQTAAGTTLLAGSMLWQARVVGAWGKVEQYSYGNGITSKAVFEAATGRVTDLTAGTSNSVLAQHYTWDSLNNLQSRVDDNGDGNTGAVNETFSYGDNLNRLTGYTVSAPAIPNLSRNVALQYNALGMLLYKSDVANYTYNAQGGGVGSKPHALQSVAGVLNTSYTYDANGNLATASTGKYRSLSYTSFNLPDGGNGLQGANGLPKYTWQYDENHARIKETHQDRNGARTTWYMHPGNQGGLGFESETAPGGAISNRHYLTASGQAIGVLVSTSALPTLAANQTVPTVLTNVTLVKVEYWHKDHLGSLITTTDHTGSVTARYAYDPFGKRRYTSGTYDPFGALIVDWVSTVNAGTDRGFTGHEHLDDTGIVHMNGRLYDPNLGVFMQPDPVIQDPANLQNFNRFGYCYNNPLTCSDPSGLTFWTSFRNAFIRVIALIADGMGCDGYCSVAVGAYQGYQAGGTKGAIAGGVTAYIGYEYGADFSPAQAGFFAVASGCLNSAAAGGKCSQGAVVGLMQPVFGDDFIGTVVGGCVASSLTGGRCRDGAENAAGSALGSYFGDVVARRGRMAAIAYLVEQSYAVDAPAPRNPYQHASYRGDTEAEITFTTDSGARYRVRAGVDLRVIDAILLDDMYLPDSMKRMKPGDEILIGNGIDLRAAMETHSGKYVQVNYSAMTRFSIGDILLAFDHETIHLNQFRIRDPNLWLNPGWVEIDAYQRNISNFSRYGAENYTLDFLRKRLELCRSSPRGCN